MLQGRSFSAVIQSIAIVMGSAMGPDRMPPAAGSPPALVSCGLPSATTTNPHDASSSSAGPWIVEFCRQPPSAQIMIACGVSDVRGSGLYTVQSEKLECTSSTGLFGPVVGSLARLE